MNLTNIAIVAVGRALGHGWAFEIDSADGEDLYQIFKSIGDAARTYNARPENENWPTAAIRNFELIHQMVSGNPAIVMETPSRFEASFEKDGSGSFAAKFTDNRFVLALRWGVDLDGRPSYCVVAPADSAVRAEMAEKKAACGAISPIIDAARYLADSDVVYSDYRVFYGAHVLSYGDYVEFVETVRAVLDSPRPDLPVIEATPHDADDEFADLEEGAEA